LDDVLNSSFYGVEAFFGGRKISPPRISCVVTYPICGVISTVEMTLDAVARIDLIVGNAEKARSSFDFTKSHAWWNAWAVCFGFVFAQLDSNLSCVVSYSLLTAVSLAFGVVSLVKDVAIGLATGEPVREILSRVGNNTDFANAADQWETFSNCAAGLVGSVFEPLGCVVKGALLAVSGFFRIVFALVKDGIYALAGMGSFSSNFLQSWASGSFDGLSSTVREMGVCLGDILDGLYAGAGCFVAAVFALAADVLRIPLLIAFVLASSNVRGVTYQQGISEAWESGAFSSPINDTVSLFGCAGSVIGKFFPPAGCIFDAVGSLVGSILVALFGTINVFVKAAIPNGPPGGGGGGAGAGGSGGSDDYAVRSAKAFLDYYFNTTVYQGVRDNVTALGACIGEAIDSIYPGLGCIPSEIVYFANDLLSALAFTVATAVKASALSSSASSGASEFAGDMEGAWLLGNPLPGSTDPEGGPLFPSGPFGAILIDAVGICDCLGGLVSKVSVSAGCSLRRFSRFSVLLGWNVVDVVVRTIRSSRTGLRPGELVFQAWYSGLYAAPFVAEYDRGASCLSSPLGRLSPALQKSAYYFAVLPSSAIVSSFEALVTVAECISLSLSFPQQVVAKWSEGKFLPPFANAEMAFFWLFQALSPFEIDVAGLLSSLSVAAVRLLYNASALAFSVFQSVYYDIPYSASVVRTQFSPVFDLLYEASQYAANIVSLLQEDLGSSVGALLALSVSVARAVVGIVFRAVVSAASLRDPFLDFYLEYAVGSYSYVTTDFSALSSSIGNGLRKASVSVGCAARVGMMTVYSLAEVLVDLTLRVLYGVRAEIQRLAEGSDPADPLLVLRAMASAYADWDAAGGLEGQDDLDHWGPTRLVRSLGGCSRSLDELIDPTNSCFFGSVFGSISSVALAAEATLRVAAVTARGSCQTAAATTTAANGTSGAFGCYLGAGGQEFEKQWDNNNGRLSGPLDALDELSVCVSTVGVGYFWNSNLTCLLPTAVHAGTSLLRDVVSFLVILEKTVRLGQDLDLNFYQSFDSGVLSHFTDAVLASAGCLSFVVGKANEEVACTLASLVRFASETLRTLAQVAAVASFSAQTNTFFGDNFAQRLDSGALSGPGREWKEFCGCLGGIVRVHREDAGDLVASACTLPSSFLADFVGYSVVLGDSIRWRRNFGVSIERKWGEGELLNTSSNLRVVNSLVSGMVGLGYPLAGDFLRDLVSLAIDLTGVVFQIFGDVYAGASDSVPGRLLTTWDTSDAYVLPFDDATALAGSLGNLTGRIDPFVGCFSGTVVRMASSLVLDLTQLLVVVTRTFHDGNGFARNYMFAWYQGDEMKNFPRAVNALGSCFAALVDRVSTEGGCVVGSAFSVIGATYVAIIQFLVDVVVSPWALRDSNIGIDTGTGTGTGTGNNTDWQYGTFDQSWSSGVYSPLGRAMRTFYSCVGTAAALFDPSFGCAVKWLLQSAQSVFLDALAFVLAFTRSLRLGTNFGRELDSMIRSGMINSTTEDTENLVTCLLTEENDHDDGDDDGGSGSGGKKRGISSTTDLFLCLPSWGILVATRTATALLLFAAEIARGAPGGASSMYYAIKNDWDAGRFEPVFDAVDGFGVCVGNVLERLSPRLKCFGPSPVFFASGLARTVVQMALDAFDPNSGTGTANTFKSSWESGKYAPLFRLEDRILECVADPLSDFDRDLSCALHLGLKYGITLFTDAIDLALVIYGSVTGSVNFGSALKSRMAQGAVNATYQNTASLQPCLSGVGGRYLGGFGCLPASLLLWANGVLKVGLTFVADVAEGASSPSRFGSVLVSSWNNGSYDVFYDGIDAVATCLNTLLSEVDPVVGCFPSTLLVFASQILKTATQMALDIFVTNDFYDSWNGGKYDVLWTVETNLIRCFGNAFSLVDERIACPMTTILRYGHERYGKNRERER
jgi:hypothetical protein